MTEIKETQAVEPLDRNKKIYVAGHCGLVGSGLVRCLEKAGFKNIVTQPKWEASTATIPTRQISS